MIPSQEKFSGRKYLGEWNDRLCKSPVFFTHTNIHCKKRFAVFPSPSGMSQTKLSLAGNNYIIPGQRLFGLEIANLILQCRTVIFRAKVKALPLKNLVPLSCQAV
jgi:hypothetical protein